MKGTRTEVWRPCFGGNTGRASPPPLRIRPKEALDPAVVRQLISAAETTHPVLSRAIAVAATTGLRCGELCGLLGQAFGRLTKKLGVAVTLHDLRHFTATHAIAAGVDMRTVAGRLGHADPSVTLRVYASFVVERDRQGAGLLGELLATPA